MEYRDYLAVAATKPILYGGVPFTYMALNISLSAAPGLLLILLGFNQLLVSVICGALFFCAHKIGVYFTRRDSNFMSVYLKTTSLVPNKKGSLFWKGYNSYRI